MKYGESVTFGS